MLPDDAVFCDGCGIRLSVPTVNAADSTKESLQAAASNWQGAGHNAAEAFRHAGAAFKQSGMAFAGTVTAEAGKGFGVERILALIAAGLCMLMPFLPLASAFGESINFVYVEGEFMDGIFFILCGIVAVVFTLLNKKIGIFVPGIIAGLMSLFEIYNFYSGEHRYFTEYLGIGFFGTMLGGFMLLGVGIFNFVLWMQARQPKQVGYVQM